MTRCLRSVVLLAAFALVINAFGAGIKWTTDLNAALKLAKKAKKPVMIDFYGTY